MGGREGGREATEGNTGAVRRRLPLSSSQRSSIGGLLKRPAATFTDLSAPEKLPTSYMSSTAALRGLLLNRSKPLPFSEADLSLWPRCGWAAFKRSPAGPAWHGPCLCTLSCNSNTETLTFFVFFFVFFPPLHPSKIGTRWGQVWVFFYYFFFLLIRFTDVRGEKVQRCVAEKSGSGPKRWCETIMRVTTTLRWLRFPEGNC